MSTPTTDAAERLSAHRGRGGAMRGVDHANIMSMELLAAILTWTGIGWYLDRVLGTGPWLVAIGALVGNAAGLYLIYLRAQRMDAEDAKLVAAAEEERLAIRRAAGRPDEGPARPTAAIERPDRRTEPTARQTPPASSDATTFATGQPAGIDGGRR